MAIKKVIKKFYQNYVLSDEKEVIALMFLYGGAYDDDSSVDELCNNLFATVEFVGDNGEYLLDYFIVSDDMSHFISDLAFDATMGDVRRKYEMLDVHYELKKLRDAMLNGVSVEDAIAKDREILGDAVINYDKDPLVVAFRNM